MILDWRAAVHSEFIRLSPLFHQLTAFVAGVVKYQTPSTTLLAIIAMVQLGNAAA